MKGRISSTFGVLSKSRLKFSPRPSFPAHRGPGGCQTCLPPTRHTRQQFPKSFAMRRAGGFRKEQSNKQTRRTRYLSIWLVQDRANKALPRGTSQNRKPFKTLLRLHEFMKVAQEIDALVSVLGVSKAGVNNDVPPFHSGSQGLLNPLDQLLAVFRKKQRSSPSCFGKWGG